MTTNDSTRPRADGLQARRGSARLDRSDWVDAAGDLLVRRGVDAVKIEPLAKSLSVTKGSFYWHFKDRDALLDAMLEDWRQRLTLSIIERLEASGESPAERLHALLTLRRSSDRTERDVNVELAIRLWARTDPRARAAIQQTDDLRLDYFTRLFEQLGATAEAARAKAVLAYSYMRVAASLLYRQDDGELASVKAILLS